jgi:hypothetical protein
MYRIEITIDVKPGRLEDAIADMHAANEATQRLSGVTGQMFLVSAGARVFGGVRMTWDFDSSEAFGRFDVASATDPGFQALIARVTSADSAWVAPAPREGLQQIV